jgi:hypothetical protein
MMMSKVINKMSPKGILTNHTQEEEVLEEGTSSREITMTTKHLTARNNTAKTTMVMATSKLNIRGEASIGSISSSNLKNPFISRDLRRDSTNLR